MTLGCAETLVGATCGPKKRASQQAMCCGGMALLNVRRRLATPGTDLKASEHVPKPGWRINGVSSDERDNAEPSVLGYLRAHFPVVRSSHSKPCRNEEMLAYNLHAWQEGGADDIDGARTRRCSIATYGDSQCMRYVYLTLMPCVAFSLGCDDPEARMSLWVAWHEVVSCVKAVIHGRSKDTLDRWQIPADLACCGTALAQRMSLHTGRKRTRGV